MTIASLFPDTPVKQAAFGAALLVGSYVLAGLVNASPVVQPRLKSQPPRGVILVVPPGTPDATDPTRIRPSNQPPTRAL